MHFLIDASLPRSAAMVLRQLDHVTTDVRDAGMRAAKDEVIAEYARSNHLVVVTRDFDFADVRNYPPSLYDGIVVIKVREDATAAHITKVLGTFAKRTDWLAHLKGRLAIVEEWRVRFRPS